MAPDAVLMPQGVGELGGELVDAGFGDILVFGVCGVDVQQGVLWTFAPL